MAWFPLSPLDLKLTLKGWNSSYKPIKFEQDFSTLFGISQYEQASGVCREWGGKPLVLGYARARSEILYHRGLEEVLKWRKLLKR